MNYEVKREYYIRILKSKRNEITYKNSTGYLYLKNDELYASFCDNDDILIDEHNIKYASCEMFFGGNMHVYRIVDGVYKLLKVYTKYFRNNKDIHKKHEECIAKFGDDIIAIMLPTNKAVSLDGIKAPI